MSDISDDDLANNYGPTTPAPPPKKARQRTGSVRPVAGPSTKTASKTVASKRLAARAESAIDLDEDEDENEVLIIEPSKKRKVGDESEGGVGSVKAKKGSGRVGTVTNGAPKSAAAKGKGRAESATAANGASDETMEVVVDKGDMREVDEDEVPDPPNQRGARLGAKQTKGRSAATTARQAKVEERLTRDIENLRAELEQSREAAKEIATQRDRLVSQLEEVLRIRHTDAEQALSEYKAHYDDSMKRKESLIQELTGRLAKLQAPGDSNQTYTLHFLTREAADEEKRALQEESNRYKELIKQRDAWLGDKDKQMNALRNEVDTLKKERDAEIERSMALAARAVPAATAGQSRPTVGETKNAPVIRLYEDMTNVLVTSLKYEKSEKWPELEEEIMTCIYTYMNAEDNLAFSLNFTLRNIYDAPEDNTGTGPIARDKLVQKMMYQPKDLDREPQQFIERLGFFKDAFMFSRDQTSVFLKSLMEAVINMFETDEADGPNEIVMVNQ